MEIFSSLDEGYEFGNVYTNVLVLIDDNADCFSENSLYELLQWASVARGTF